MKCISSTCSAESLTLGAGGDAGLYVTSDDLVIENITDGKDIKINAKNSTSRTVIFHDADEGETKDKCTTVEDGTEVYFMGNLFRSKGEMAGTEYDKLKVSLSFLEETDRVKKRGGGGRKSKATSMRSQLDASFEETESEATKLSAEELAVKASVALSDF